MAKTIASIALLASTITGAVAITEAPAMSVSSFGMGEFPGFSTSSAGMGRFPA